MRRSIPWIALAAAAAGCSGADPAPGDLDGMARWFYDSFETADDEQIQDAVRRLAALVSADTLEEPLRLELAPRAEGARGMLAVTVVRCPLSRVEELHILSTDQKGIHPGFDRHVRTFQGDVAAYRAREVLVIGFENRYTVSLLGSSYDAIIDSSARFVPAPEEGGAPGPVLLVRGTLREPAVFNNQDDYFTHDFQAQALWERRPGETMHLYAVWRDMRLAGMEMNGGETLFYGTLSSLIRGDEELEQKCNE